MAQAIAEMSQVGFGRGAKEVAEKGLILCEAGRGRPSGAKARVDFEAFTARLKSCPDAYRPFARVFPQPVKPDSFCWVYVRAEARTLH